MQSQIIFKNQHYTACTMKDGSLIVSNNHKQYGKRLVGNNAEFWIEAIKTAIDTRESAMLCKAIINS
jgi:hypothetical protein